ncbi:MAG TPA: hypothetical protein VGC58_00765 [Candidatus Paceibacterota bacterium]
MYCLSIILSKYQTQNIIAIFALIFAYYAYRKSIIYDYQSWLDLAKSFQSELNYAKGWIGNSYSNDFEKDWRDPTKIVYPLTSEAVKAMIHKGHPPKNLFSKDFFEKLALYNERIEAFNHILNIQGMNFLNSDMYNKKEELDVFQSKAEYINKIIHKELISDKNNPNGLHYLYNYFSHELRDIGEKETSIVPWYFRYHEFILIAVIVFYLILDIFIQ